jgi:hypothetical protein
MQRLRLRSRSDTHPRWRVAEPWVEAMKAAWLRRPSPQSLRDSVAGGSGRIRLVSSPPERVLYVRRFVPFAEPKSHKWEKCEMSHGDPQLCFSITT